MLSSIGYSHTHPSYLASLHCSYSAQLESLGAWQWAVFVAQHIEDPVLRCHTVEGVVSRHCTSNEELNEQEQFVIDKLSVSRCVVYKAKVHMIRTILPDPFSYVFRPYVLNTMDYIHSRPFIWWRRVCGMKHMKSSSNMLHLKPLNQVLIQIYTVIIIKHVWTWQLSLAGFYVYVHTCNLLHTV